MPELAGPRATVIVLNYNGAAHLERCLDTVAAQHLAGGFEVLVADNGSVDGSERIAEVRPDLRLIRLGRNLGFAAGNNAAIREARGEHVVLLNNDAFARPGWLQALVDAAESQPRVGAVTSKLIFANRPGVIQNAGLLLLSDGAGADRGSGEPDGGAYDQRQEVFGFCGAATLLSRAMLDDVGMFDERFFTYYEDTDLSWRMRLRGWKVLYEPHAEVDHVHAASAGEWSDFFVFHVDRNRVLMLLKCARLGFLINGLAALVRRAGASGTPEGPTSGRRTGVTHWRVAASLLWHLPGFLASRWRVRGRRTSADREIELWAVSRAHTHEGVGG